MFVPEVPPVKVVTIGDVIIGALSCCILQTRKMTSSISFFCDLGSFKGKVCLKAEKLRT